MVSAKIRKSDACKCMEQLGHGCTLNQSFSVGMAEDETKTMNRFDDSSYDVIVFYELYFANIRMLARIKQGIQKISQVK